MAYFSYTETVLLVGARITPILLGGVNTPFSRVPVLIRTILVVFCAISLSYLIGFKQAQSNYFVKALGIELFLGLSLLLVVQIVFSAFAFLGRVVDMQMGLGASGIFNPSSNSQDSILGTFFSLALITIFFVSGAYLVLLDILLKSFSIFQLGSDNIWLSPDRLAKFWGAQLIIVLSLFAPIMIVLWTVDIVVGMVSKTMPQVNVYFVTLPLKIAIGLMLCAAVAAYAKPVYESMFSLLFNELRS